MKQIVLYTAEDCPYCYAAEKILRKVLDEYKGLFNYRSIKVNAKQDLKISSLPTIFVGQTKIVGLPDKEEIHSALFS